MNDIQQPSSWHWPLLWPTVTRGSAFKLLNCKLEPWHFQASVQRCYLRREWQFAKRNQEQTSVSFPQQSRNDWVFNKNHNYTLLFDAPWKHCYYMQHMLGATNRLWFNCLALWFSCCSDPNSTNQRICVGLLRRASAQDRNKERLALRLHSTPPPHFPSLPIEV